MMFLRSELSLDFPLVQLGEVFRARVTQSTRRPASAVSQHHVQSGEGVSSTAYRGSRAAILWYGEPSDESR